MAASREQFGSRLGFVLAAAGSAVGIGNLVGFPVNAAKNGGGAFLLMYAIFVFTICVPVMMAELAAGRHSAKGPLGMYASLTSNHRGWAIAGWLSTITPFMIAVFYTVITVWIFEYLYNALTGDLRLLAEPGTFGEFISGGTVFVHLAIVLAIVNLILVGGVKEGIERSAKVLMPTLFLMLIGMVIFVLTRENAMAGVEFYLIPDFSKITGPVVSGALGQAFFSLSLGMGILITYGSYMDKRSSIPGSAKMVALADTGVAFCAGLMILPAIFSFNPETNPANLSDSSVSLIFTFLPKIFLALEASIGYTGASAVASVFFLLVFFAALTSLVSIIEVPAASLVDQKGYSRKKALLVLNALMLVFTLACTASFGMVDWLTGLTRYAGASKSLFDIVYDVFYDTILPLNGLLICLFVIYRWKKHNLDAELESGDEGFKGSLLERYMHFSLGTFIPFILAVIFINTVAIKFFGHSLLASIGF